jgi:hypothetical protein
VEDETIESLRAQVDRCIGSLLRPLRRQFRLAGCGNEPVQPCGAWYSVEEGGRDEGPALF